MFYDLGQGSCSIPPLNSLQQSRNRVPPSFKGKRNRLHLFVGNIKFLEEHMIPEILLWPCLKNTVCHIPAYPRDQCFPSILFSSVFFPLCTLMLAIITPLLVSLATALKKKACSYWEMGNEVNAIGLSKWN